MSGEVRRPEIRNVAIVAHVDHGKTTLVDALLSQTGAHLFKTGEKTILDSNDLEKERGITIFSKNASIVHKGVRLNIVDTPGHADFGSEVERILRMVDGVLLLVDAFDGPMPQTKFVLRKSLELGLCPILVVNKIDRSDSRPVEVTDLTFDLFCDLNANDKQLDFPICYASARSGYAVASLDDERKDMQPLLDLIVEKVPGPIADVTLPFQMLVTMLEYDSYIGRIALGRIVAGTVRVGETVAMLHKDDGVKRAKVTKLLMCQGLKRVEVESASAGDIVYLAGLDGAKVGCTIASSENPLALPDIAIDEPTISMLFSHNTSPLSGKDGGKFLTSRHIRERLEREAMTNVGIRVEEVASGERFKVSGRGELHLAILIETMRRESYEMEVSPPEVILKKIDGKLFEPVEEVIIEVDPGYEGGVIQELGGRKAIMRDMKTSAIGTIRLDFFIASRALIGFRSELMVMTRGTGVMNQNFYEYQPYKGELPSRQVGVLISHGPGQAVAYGLAGLQDRGEIFIKPQDDVYDGMIVGTNNKGTDLVVNVMRSKKLTNMRASGTDDAINLIPPRNMTLEYALEFIEPDELVEITPKSIRLRKFYLDETERKRKKNNIGS